MSRPPSSLFAAPGSPQEVERELSLCPRFDADGLIPAIVTDATSGEVLMFAWMNAEALARTIETRQAHFWSRSRDRLWRKGEDSGNTLDVVELRIDCDQDAVWLKANINGNKVACHTGAATCFYRSVPLGSTPDPTMTLVKVPAICPAKPASR
jgi:phosphoribosyl-AMP cyclohydrolase